MSTNTFFEDGDSKNVLPKTIAMIEVEISAKESAYWRFESIPHTKRACTLSLSVKRVPGYRVLLEKSRLSHILHIQQYFCRHSAQWVVPTLKSFWQAVMLEKLASLTGSWEDDTMLKSRPINPVASQRLRSCSLINVLNGLDENIIVLWINFESSWSCDGRDSCLINLQTPTLTIFG